MFFLVATFARSTRSTYLPRGKAQVISFRPGTSLEALAATSMPLRRWSHGSKGDNSALRLVGSVTVKAGGIWCDTRASGTPSKWIEAGSSTRWT